MIDLSDLQRLPEWMHVRDADLRLVWATNHARLAFGWENPEPDEPIDLEDAQRISEATRTAREVGHWSGRLTRQDERGNERTLESRWSALTDVSGTVTGYFVIEQDLSEQSAQNEQMIRAQRMESIGTLAGGVAHDINNVLGPIILGAEMIRRKVDDPWILKKIDRIENSARRGADIVGQVLDFSRGAEGEKIPVQIRHVMKELVEFAQHTFSKQITVEGSFPRDLSLILGDAAQIRQAVLNLMVNARDAIEGSGTVSVDMEDCSLDAERAAALSADGRDGQFVAISVTDTGGGIPEDIQDRIFEPFFSTHRRGQGSGLGLSSTLAIVKGHHGFMSITSHPGKGSRFTIYLPQAETASLSEREPGSESKLRTSYSSHTILFVDDEPLMLEMNADMLSSFGHRTLIAGHGQAGLDLFFDDPEAIDLVITDINMPVMDGPTMIQEMRRRRPDLPVIAVSGLSEDDHARDGTGLENIGILRKPYSTGQLLDMIADKMGDTASGGSGESKPPDDATSSDHHTGDTLSDSDFDDLMGGDW